MLEERVQEIERERERGRKCDQREKAFVRLRETKRERKRTRFILYVYWRFYRFEGKRIPSLLSFFTLPNILYRAV